MLPNRLSAKLFFDSPKSPDPSAFIPIFHDWIRRARVPGVPLDVANYSHVRQGPSLLLVAHAGDYVLDFTGGRAGLRYVHKRDWPGDTLTTRLHTTLEGLIRGARLLEGETSLPKPVRFHTGELRLTFLDRLNTPNTPPAFEAIRGDVHAVLASFYGVDDVQLSRLEQDGRYVLTIDARLPVLPALAGLQRRLATLTQAA